MKLLLAILGVLARKAVLVTLLAGALVLLAFVSNWTREQNQIARRIEDARALARRSSEEWRFRRMELLGLEKQLQRLQAEEPPWYRPLERVQWRARLAAAEAAVETARAARDQAHHARQEALAELNRAEQQVDRAWVGFLAAARRTGGQILLIAGLVLAGPPAWKAFWYYGLAALASRRPPVRLLPGDTPGEITAGARGKMLPVEVTPAQPLLARMDWVQQYSPSLAKRTRFLFDWHSPFTSFAAGLAEMTELSAGSTETAGQVWLAAGNDPHAHVLALHLNNHPGVVLKPGAVVAVAGDITLRPRWHVRSLHHWIAGRLRHILFCGTGTVYVTGHGGVEVNPARQATVIEEALVLGYDSRAAFATVRTETFWPYLRGKTSLFDYRFDAGRLAIRQTSIPDTVRRGNPLVRTVDALLNGIGKLFGF